MLTGLVSFAQAEQPKANFHGPYLGLKGGISFLRGEIKNSSTSQNNQVSNLSYLFGAQGGYLHNVDGSKMVLGGELGISYPGNKVSKSNPSITANMRYTMNASFIAGTIMNPRTLLFARAGTNWQSMALKTGTRSNSKTTQALAVGVGAMYEVAKHWIACGSVTLSAGRKISSSDGAVSYQPKQYTFVASISYLF